MAKYIIKLTPLEPYFFGGENTFRFDEEEIKKSNYFIKSLRVPPAP